MGTKMKLCLVAGWLRLAASLEFPEMIGLNVPWNNFGYDIGNDAFDSTWFETYFASAETNGHNVARFWVHTDGARAGLVYNSDGTVQGLSDSYTRDLRSLLTLTQKHRIVCGALTCAKMKLHKVQPKHLWCQMLPFPKV